MISNMVGSKSAIVGFMVHLMISFIFGLTYAFFTALFKGNRVTLGVIYGVVLWFVFPFIFMPLMMGMPAFSITSSSMMSLMGHIIYGLVTGVVYQAIEKRTNQNVSKTENL
jgi:uncharacterized membrane protein YagU involved in acid resistance